MDELELPTLEESVESYPLNKAAIARFVRTQKDSVINNVFTILSKKKSAALIQESGVSYVVNGEEMAIYRGIGSTLEEFIHEKKIKFDEPRKRLVEAKQEPQEPIEEPKEVEKEKFGLLDVLDAIYQDQLPDGVGDKSKPSDFNLKQILQGILVELEHTSDEMLALEIAIDHLAEDPSYYTKLKKIHKDEETDKYGVPSMF